MTNNGFTISHAEGMSLDGLYPVAVAAADVGDEDYDDYDYDDKGSGGGDIKHKEINFSDTSTSETFRRMIFSMFYRIF